ncbi:excalibur calcium-binding domain-containing protein [Peribacillus aracenensis]|uniref:excalibur calcium-binding domain-containing protein n=1 Tax=Peribacillus aracenensis TaxID=2976708 RepID=UPI0021A26276|nr:excalibur calcium-binding domain-containing protein [Peribacillus sp. BBB004]
MKKSLSVVLSFGLVLGISVGTGNGDEVEAASKTYKNCTEFNKKYSKGVAKSAKTKNKVVSKKTKKVTYKPLSKGTKISSTIYKEAMKNNDDLDRDNDGIACEK